VPVQEVICTFLDSPDDIDLMLSIDVAAVSTRNRASAPPILSFTIGSRSQRSRGISPEGCVWGHRDGAIDIRVSHRRIDPARANLCRIYFLAGAASAISRIRSKIARPANRNAVWSRKSRALQFPPIASA